MELLFGAAYYAEYMPYPRTDKDLDMMKAAGMNVIRIAESTWSTFEPHEGVYRFDYIDEMIAAAAVRDMKVIVGTPTYAIPSWLYYKDPIIMVMHDGVRLPYGARQIMDITNPTYKSAAEHAIRQLIQHVAKFSNVIGYQIDNETKHYDISGDRVEKMFKEYLMNKFGTVEAFNSAYVLNYWSNSIGRWDDLPPIQGTINGGLATEFCKFKRSIAADFLKWQRAIVDEYRREDQFVTHNFDFEWKKGENEKGIMHSFGVQPGINHYEASDAVTIAGTDIYHPTQDDLTGAEIAYCGDSIRCLKDDNYLLLETEAQAFKEWTPYPGQLRLQAYSHIANGAVSVMYWNWHSIHNSFETYWKGVLSHDLDTNPVYEEACLIGKEFAQFGNVIGGIKKNNKVALLVDNHSMDAFKWFGISDSCSYTDIVRWMYDALYELNIECDVIDVNKFVEMQSDRYETIITPALYSASQELIDKLKNFVFDGGRLISSFKSFFANENLTVYSDAQPHGLTDVFGMTYNQFTEPGTTTIDGQPVKYWAELLNAKSAQVFESYEHKYWGQYAGITYNRYGSGEAWYIGCYTTKEELKKVYKKAFGLSDNQEEWPVIIRSGQNKNGDKLHFIFNYSQDTVNVICKYTEVESLFDSKIYKKGDNISLKDFDVVILREL